MSLWGKIIAGLLILIGTQGFGMALSQEMKCILYHINEQKQMLFYIPFHNFSCPHCMEYQNKLLSKDDVLDIIGNIDSQDGEILHPNCKCSLNIYTEYSKFNKPKYSNEELEEQYQIRQKTNTLTLRKEEVITDMKIQKMLGNQDEVDKLNQQRNKINKEIRKLKEALPTKELQIQVVAIFVLKLKWNQLMMQ